MVESAENKGVRRALKKKRKERKTLIHDYFLLKINTAMAIATSIMTTAAMK